MIFIFDWGHTTEKRIGPLSSEDIMHELPGEYFWLTVKRKWFRLFFIPTIPTETAYFFISEAASIGKRIEKHTFKKYRPLAVLNRRAMEDKISDEEYLRERAKMDFA
jgi:hypothetical protein